MTNITQINPAGVTKQERELLTKLSDCLLEFRELPRMNQAAGMDDALFSQAITSAMNVVASRSARRQLGGEDMNAQSEAQS